MAFNQTRDLLDHAWEFHRDLACFYENIQEIATNERTRELLENLIDHEQKLGKGLKAYESEVSDNILDTFFKYVIDGRLELIGDYPVPDEVDTGYVLEAARHFDEQLGSFYKAMARKALSEQVREVLLNLMEMELREQMSLSKQALELAAT